MKDFLIGFIMGIANLLPGISGGTIVFVSGRYPQVIGAISHLMRFKLRKNDALLLSKIAAGAVLSIFLLSRVIDSLYKAHPLQTSSFFAGLIAGGLVLMWKDVKLKELPMLVLGSVLMVLISLSKALDTSGMAMLTIGGFIAGGTMILPGVSGSSMLVILGVYDEAIDAVANLKILDLGVLGAAALFGVGVFSFLMEKLLKKYESSTMSFLYGLTLAGFVLIILGGADVIWLVTGAVSMIAMGKFL